MTYSGLIIFFWIIFIAYWLISAVGVKQDITKGGTWWRYFLLRFVFLVLLVWLLDQGTFAGFWTTFNGLPLFSIPIVRVIGVILCALGIMFAIWARWHLGRNWSGTPQIKKDHELVTSGPYTFVRHPIYTGMTLALFGSALATGPAWSVAFVSFLIVFLLRIPKEEGYMMKLFPDKYPEYKKRTKALIPFIW